MQYIAYLHKEKKSDYGVEHPIINQFMRQCSAAEIGPRALAGNAGEGLLTFWKISTHGTGGLTGNHIVKIGMNADGDRAPWLERLEDKISAMQTPTESAVK
jgi:hypothetical protein